MPRYLRWIAAITTGLIVQLLFQIVILAAFVGTGNTVQGGGTAAIVTFGAGILNVIVCLAINDWLSTRYPLPPRSTAASRKRSAADADNSR